MSKYTKVKGSHVWVPGFLGVAGRNIPVPDLAGGAASDISLRGRGASRIVHKV